MQNLVTWQTKTGKPTQVYDITITPQSQVLQITFPFGGLVWNRPTGILVDHNGRTEQIPITDITRSALWVFFGLALLVNLFIWLINRK